MDEVLEMTATKVVNVTVALTRYRCTVQGCSFGKPCQFVTGAELSLMEWGEGVSF